MLNGNSLELLVYPNISSYEKLNEYYWMLTYYLYPIRNKINNIYIQSELKLDKGAGSGGTTGGVPSIDVRENWATSWFMMDA